MKPEAFNGASGNASVRNAETPLTWEKGRGEGIGKGRCAMSPTPAAPLPSGEGRRAEMNRHGFA
jgi:hypothetical protein